MDDVKLSLLTQDLLSIRRLAQILDCSPKTVQDWLYKERKDPSSDPLPYYRIGGLVRFKPNEVIAWIERRRVRVGTLTFLREPKRI
jgi:predicted DNA-binding transcriptional regulator AlpA